MGLEKLTTLRLYRNENITGECEECMLCFTTADGGLFVTDDSF